MNVQTIPFCPICSNPMKQKLSDWNCYCASCDYWCSTFKNMQPSFDTERDYGELLSSLDTVRAKNFDLILTRIEALVPKAPLRILDVGCATGLFIQQARQRGHAVAGVEPNEGMVAIARSRGIPVQLGYFPDALAADDAFDVIIFNDVFEHIPNLADIITGIRRKLAPDGLLVVNLPNSNGFLFGLGKFIHRLGSVKLWERLWQKLFHAPHLHYFNEKSLNKLFSVVGMLPCHRPVELPVLSVAGLWRRIAFDKSLSRTRRVLIYLSALVLYPILALFPKDSIVLFYRKTSSTLMPSPIP